jgi:glycosyltransferase involved in cell wall biosynthesis
VKILLLSAYHSASHRYWCEGMMAALPEHQWVLKTQPARHFSWRVSASGIMWGLSADSDFSEKYDLIVATSLTDLANLKAHCPSLQNVPVWLYFHENQFAHPVSDSQRQSHQIQWQFQSILNALLADSITFNSHFNRTTFLEGAKKLLEQFPEKVPGNVAVRLEEISSVLPVPLQPMERANSRLERQPDLIVWNHRWEWDKQPERFLKALMILKQRDVAFHFAMVGTGGGRSSEWNHYREALSKACLYWGEVDRQTYLELLEKAGIGVSTALHDFQGLSVLELAQAGARLILPRRVAYPETVPNAWFYEGAEEDPEQEVLQLAALLEKCLLEKASDTQNTYPLLFWSDLVDRYRKTILEVSALQTENARRVQT